MSDLERSANTFRKFQQCSEPQPPDNHRELQPSKAFEVDGYQETEYPQHLRPSNPTVKRDQLFRRTD